MTKGELKKILNEDDLPDDVDVFFPNHVNICGNINPIYSVKRDTRAVFGELYDCLILSNESEEDD